MNITRVIGGIEGGGTKFNAVVVEEPTEGYGSRPKVLDSLQVATTTPDETIDTLIDFIQAKAGSKLQALGAANFGPLDLDSASSSYGQITATPKPGWAGVDLSARLESSLQVPVYLDTDVNGAALGEYLWGAGKDTPNLLYLTVGTGIGGGLLIDGKPYHGLCHPEMGHIRIPHSWDKDPFNGVCSFHGDCLEGLASGPALMERWHTPAEKLPPNHPAWVLEAEYLAVALANYTLTLSPQRIILGGGIMNQTFIFPMIRTRMQAALNQYLPNPAILEMIDQFIVPAGLGDQAGVLGAVGLALIHRQS